jgi:predicted SprT family Zn-dependent metalloprotease
MKIRITEGQLNTLKKNISEEKEHTDDEIVNFKEINLQNEFRKLNDLLFDGKLKPVQMLWNNRKVAHGVVKASRNRVTNEISVHSLSMSQFLKIPYRFFKDVLAHEMIHVYLLQKGINDGHGLHFRNEMNRINQMGLGFKVTVTSNESNFEVSDHMAKNSADLVAGFFMINGKIGMSVMKMNTYKTESKGISNTFKYLCEKGKYREVSGEFYQTSDPQLLRMQISRSFRSGVSYNWIEESEYNKIKSGGRFLSSFKTNGNEVIWEGPEQPSELAPKPSRPKKSKWGNGLSAFGF